MFMLRFTLFLFMFFVSTNASGQIIIINPNESVNKVIQEAPKPLVKHFGEALKQYENWVNNVSNEEVYKSLKIRDRTTGEIVDFKDLSDLKKDLFYLWQSELCGNKMSSLESKWFNSYNNAEDLSEEGEGEGEGEDLNRLANKKDISKYGKSLRTLREKHAKNYENLIKKIFEKHKDVIPEKDQEAYLKRIQDWNSKEKLIKEENR